MYNDKIPELISFFFYIQNNYNFFFKGLVPCHNDLVPENLLLNKDKLFIIDWEYSGMNNPLFDISSLFIESNFDNYQKDFFLENYFNKNFYIKNRDKIILEINIYNFLQDLLWFLWTVVKEENRECFGDYAKIRLERAFKIKKELL